MSAICIITARGGSKRIPHKNIRDFRGEPIIAYSIEAARDSGVFDVVMVSTDDEKIAETARKYGASVPFMRSVSASDDNATTADVIVEVLSEYANMGMEFDIVCCLYPTAPFVTSKKLGDAMRWMSEGYDSVIPVVAFSFPPQRGYVVRDGQLDWWFPEYKMVRSQDLNRVFHDAGQYYVSTVESFLSRRSFLGSKVKPVVVPETEAQDIDVESDWEIAELKYELMQRRGDL